LSCISFNRDSACCIRALPIKSNLEGTVIDFGVLLVLPFFPLLGLVFGLGVLLL